MPSVAITIGSYSAPDFVRLNIRACRRVFGSEVPILVSDDRSAVSTEVERVAEEEGAAFSGCDRRRSHCSGDWQAYVAGCVWGRTCDADISIKLSQRFIPAAAGFESLLLSPFEEGKTQVVYPPSMNQRNAVRPGVRFYSRFPILTDCIAWRTSAISAEEMAFFYSDRLREAKKEADSLVEFAWHQLITNRFQSTAVALDALANPTPMQPKLYLRKASALDAEYQRLANELECPGMFDTREWLQIEGHKYMCRPTTV